MLFAFHILALLQALRCQTSPNFSYLKYGKVDKNMELDFSEDGGLLYYITSVLLSWETDGDSCLAVDMIPSKSEPWDRKGSLSLLWPLFQSLCLGQFIETISCTVQGRPHMAETGMTIFEHSLAFAEAETMISNRLGLSLFGPPQNGHTKATSFSGGEPTVTKLFTKSDILEKMNTPPEVLLMVLISSLNNFSSQVLGLLDMQSRLRLLNTGIWGLCFMGTFIWGIFSARPESGPEAMILRFPTVCIVGFIPHMLVLVGILLCASIYALALTLCFLSPPIDGPSAQSFAARFKAARENMQANVQLSSIRLDMQEDFYTSILKVGFNALTIASEAVYLNEGQQVTVPRLTWLEEQRMKDLEVFEQLNDPSRRIDVEWEEAPTSVGPDSRSGRPWKNGYDRQINPKAGKSGLNDPTIRADGVGHMQRFGRYAMAATFLRGIFRLYLRWLRLLTSRMLDRAGMTRQPQWLRFPKNDEEKDNQDKKNRASRPKFLPFWLEGEDGRPVTPKNENFDVEAEYRRRIRKAKENWTEVDEEDENIALDSQTYDWWKRTGQFGLLDGSGSYQASILDDDTTSVISTSTDTSWADHNDFGDDSGARTPTQRSPNPSSRRESPSAESIVYQGQGPSYVLPGGHLNPEFAIEPHPLDPSHLASLLDAKTSEKRAEARMLKHHMNAPNITTRSQYRHAQAFASAKLLTSTRYRPANSTIPICGPLSPEEEAQLLEQLIISRRSRSLPSDPAAAGWRDGAAGMGQSGPQCVVCQCEPRTILAWPCRCLSLCEDCRVTLAMNNETKCVCCRQSVVGFARLFVP